MLTALTVVHKPSRVSLHNLMCHLMRALLTAAMSAQPDFLFTQAQCYSRAQAEQTCTAFVTVGTVEKISNHPSTHSLETQFYNLP